MRGAYVVVAIALAGVVVALGVGLAQLGARSAGTNSTNPIAFVAVLPAGGRACQAGESVPPHVGSIDLDAGSYGRPGPPVRVTIGPHTSGATAGGYPDGWVRVPLRGPLAEGDHLVGGVSICVENRGRSQVALAGLPLPEGNATVNGRPAAGRFSLRWQRPGQESWWSVASTIAERATVAKADLGKWTPIVLLGLLWAGALTLVLRRARE